MYITNVLLKAFEYFLASYFDVPQVGPSGRKRMACNTGIAHTVKYEHRWRPVRYGRVELISVI